jgi:SAM-dependent methyltransferase
MKQNKFNQELPEISEILKNDVVRDYVRNTLVSVLETLEISSPNDLVDEVLQLAESYQSLEEYEKNTHEFLGKKGVTTERIGSKLSHRADIIYSQIQKYLIGSKVLDLGCGDGKVGEKLAQSRLEVTLADIYKHQHIDETGLRFARISQDGDVPLENEQYDVTLLLTVLHHSDDPLKTLQEAKKLTKKGRRIIVIESVYGIDPGEVDNADEFANLTHEQQRLANIFFDHFYNRIIHYSKDPSKKVNVPFNFNTPKGWNKEAEKLGMKEITTQHLGIDQPTVPEYHTLHVYEV